MIFISKFAVKIYVKIKSVRVFADVLGERYRHSDSRAIIVLVDERSQYLKFGHKLHLGTVEGIQLAVSLVVQVGDEPHLVFQRELESNLCLNGVVAIRDGIDHFIYISEFAVTQNCLVVGHREGNVDRCLVLIDLDGLLVDLVFDGVCHGFGDIHLLVRIILAA